MKITSILSLIIVLSFFSCEKTKTIEGLWVVKSVVVGDEEMTPNARWTRFNSDLTQESGNGRFQHSYGTWKLNQNSNELVIENTNELDDINEPFVISLNQSEMIWERTEEGQNIKVILERSSQLPETHGDKILGLWVLEKAIGNGRYFKESDQKEIKDYIFFRWDKRFVIESEKGRVNGVYNVHGHKPEVELIPYGSQVKRDFWGIHFEENQITLKLLNSDTIVTRQFRRMRKFPD
ncbi:hypothetical protein DWB61_10905 [Ancylomarina euxinus]|uniref:Lipocalin-like domain-containing protein n=1 Tax=Ancylomarina euxinus TaxID=2283627 RepID=A0A425XZN5_9BACT|nr:hypothetical protein [Ancylomarina euxinus]MCZ4695438.1 hypothetical protein [Ancylomarina euxinus]MUP15634.1 hypothetical protein [Ancylomarina euxinus]RRG20926.1 hypothetical protein DWB61_10905 [Ancylomarina euxinus]